MSPNRLPKSFSLTVTAFIFGALWLSPSLLSAENVFPGESWEYRTTPAERAALGIDSTTLDQWVAQLSAGPANSGMIIRHGYVIAAWGDVTDWTDAWVSTWKSQVGMAAFLARDAGLMPDFSEPVRPLVQGAFGIDLIQEDLGITYLDLALNISAYGRIEDPGEAYAYADASPNLASQLVSEAVKAIEPSGWFTYMLARLDPVDGTGLQFQDRLFSTRRSTRDAARMAWLWANQGQWDGRALIPLRYFQQYVKPLTPFGLPVSTRTDPVHGDYLGVGSINIAADYQPQGAYGFWWYFNNRPVVRPGDQAVTELTRKMPGLPHDAFTAYGTGGKYMVAIPSQNMAIAVNTFPGNDWSGLMDAVLNLDRTPPTAITGFSSTARTLTSVSLSWNPATDAQTGIATYWIYRDGAWIGETSGTTFTDAGLQPYTAFTYDIQAFNTHGYATDVAGSLAVTTDPPPVVFSVNFGSSVLGGNVAMPRSEEFIAGIVVDAPWWNNHFDEPGKWMDTAQEDVPWILSNGHEPADLRMRVTTPGNLTTAAIYGTSQHVAPDEDSRDLRMHTDVYYNTAGYSTVGMEIRHLPADFQHGWNLYIATHHTDPFAHGIFRYDLDLGMDGTVDRTLYSRHQPPGDWTDDTQFSNASQAETSAGVGPGHSSYVVFQGIPAGNLSFSLDVTNTSHTDRNACINAFQIQALQQPVAYPIWQQFFLWDRPGTDNLPQANPDGDRFNNWLEYILDLHPRKADPAQAFSSSILQIEGHPWFAWTFRQNAHLTDAHLWLEHSQDLRNWTAPPPDTPGLVDEILDPDPDSDGTAILRRLRIRLHPDDPAPESPPAHYFRLKTRQK
jgi:hypothetical protein